MKGIMYRWVAILVVVGTQAWHPIQAKAALVIKAENAAIHTEGGPNSGGGWNLWSNGHVGQAVRVAAGGKYQITVRAWGSPAGGIWPEMGSAGRWASSQDGQRGTMTKRNLVRRIADDLNRTEIDTRPIVQKTLDAIINVLAAEARLELRNFGVFEVKRRKPRQARNPITGEKVMVGERLTVTFKAGRVMEERVAAECGGGAGEEAVAGD